MLPWNTITKSQYIPINSPDDYIIDSGISENNPVTVVGLSFIQGNIASEMELFSGNTLLFKNFAKDSGYVEMNFIATGTLKITKTGNDEAFFLVNYVPEIRATTTTMDKMTQGDILISFFILLLLMGSVFGFLVKRFILKQ